jgi:hypothetical protein
MKALFVFLLALASLTAIGAPAVGQERPSDRDNSNSTVEPLPENTRSSQDDLTGLEIGIEDVNWQLSNPTPGIRLSREDETAVRLLAPRYEDDGEGGGVQFDLTDF